MDYFQLLDRFPEVCIFIVSVYVAGTQYCRTRLNYFSVGMCWIVEYTMLLRWSKVDGKMSFCISIVDKFHLLKWRHRYQLIQQQTCYDPV